MHLLTAPQGCVSDVLYRSPKEATYKETVRAAEDWFGEEHPIALYHNQLKRWTQESSGPMQQFATTIEQLTHCAFPAWEIRQDIRHKMVPMPEEQEDTQRDPQADLELEITKLAVGSSIRLGKWVSGHCGGVGPLPNGWRDYRQLMCRQFMSTSHPWKFCPHKPEEDMIICLWATWDKQH
jgi:hypothetical protein